MSVYCRGRAKDLHASMKFLRDLSFGWSNTLLIKINRAGRSGNMLSRLSQRKLQRRGAGGLEPFFSSGLIVNAATFSNTELMSYA